MKLSEIKVDPAKIEAGAWVDEIPEFDGVRLKVRGLGCKEMQKLQRTLFDAIPRSRRPKGKVSQEDQDRILDRCLHEVILLDWDGLQNDDDTPMAYDKAKALTFITEPAFKKFREAVVWAADTIANDKAEAVNAVVGNSPPSSGGSSPGEAASST